MTIVVLLSFSGLPLSVYSLYYVVDLPYNTTVIVILKFVIIIPTIDGE